MHNNHTTHRIIKSNQPCFLIPWEAPRDGCPYPHNYTRVGIPHSVDRKGDRATILVVRLDNLRKQVDNTELPKGQWVNCTL